MDAWCVWALAEVGRSLGSLHPSAQGHELSCRKAVTEAVRAPELVPSLRVHSDFVLQSLHPLQRCLCQRGWGSWPRLMSHFGSSLPTCWC